MLEYFRIFATVTATAKAIDYSNFH